MSLFVCVAPFSAELRPFYASSDRIHRPPLTLLSMAVFVSGNLGQDYTRSLVSVVSGNELICHHFRSNSQAQAQGERNARVREYPTAGGTRNITGVAFPVSARDDPRALCTFSRPGTSLEDQGQDVYDRLEQ